MPVSMSATPTPLPVSVAAVPLDAPMMVRTEASVVGVVVAVPLAIHRPDHRPPCSGRSIGAADPVSMANVATAAVATATPRRDGRGAADFARIEALLRVRGGSYPLRRQHPRELQHSAGRTGNF